jgi:hypothetical protein
MEMLSARSGESACVLLFCYEIGLLFQMLPCLYFGSSLTASQWVKSLSAEIQTDIGLYISGAQRGATVNYAAQLENLVRIQLAKLDAALP